MHAVHIYWPYEGVRRDTAGRPKGARKPRKTRPTGLRAPRSVVGFDRYLWLMKKEGTHA